ncbi:hypothetical protein HPB47_002095 [Ixodes persulcatus]|uniref:Uncharacterized protein n=1 Tax=Ixodes persulcatus TaxID=34615 RepID=A0AC60PP12_IXOPE|nr:hypothetical protein HPB47_002095 [Ixodes persulcatus]
MADDESASPLQLSRPSDQVSVVGDCLPPAIPPKKPQSNSLVLSTARRLYRRSNPYIAEGHGANGKSVPEGERRREERGEVRAPNGRAWIEVINGQTQASFPCLYSLFECLRTPNAGVQRSRSTLLSFEPGLGALMSLHALIFSPSACTLEFSVHSGSHSSRLEQTDPLTSLNPPRMAPSDPAGTSGSLESVAERGPSQKHRAYVLGLVNVGAVTRVWQRVGDQVAHATSEILAGLEPTRSEFFAHDLLPLLLRMREVWWATQRHVAGNFLSLYQKYEDSPQQWLMALREVDVHLLRTAIVHREILEGELEKLARTIELDGELPCADSIRHLQDVFVKEGVGYWLAEHLDLIWSEFGNQVQKGVVNLYKAFDSPFVRSWASSSQCRADDVAQVIHESWTGFIGRVQESRRYVVEEETSSYTQDELAVDLENSSIPHRIYIYTRILRRYEALVNHDWQGSV